MGSWQTDSWQWDFHVDADELLGNLEATYEAFLLIELLTNLKPGINVSDSVKWWPNVDGQFSVKSCYSFLRDKELEDAVEPTALASINRIWRTDIPSKLKVFGWRVIFNRLPTKDQLVKRDIIHSDIDKLCALYLNVDKYLDHLLFNCIVSKKVWCKIFVWLELQNMEELEGIYHFNQFIQAVSGKIKKKKCCLICLAIIWTIWNKRNEIIFNEEICDIDEIISSIEVVLWICQETGTLISLSVAYENTLGNASFND
ncbi:unnamed protein product [Vicia faba]|uniref:Reverse transcriptase zinc-binding domain-containing protein n=1 Tax=Vicia faba TaxID=3906 RepID=A0AAV0ZYA7_VICFA|nr:unnamed protein product [Vicia faba]